MAERLVFDESAGSHGPMYCRSWSAARARFEAAMLRAYDNLDVREHQEIRTRKAEKEKKKGGRKNNMDENV